MNDMVRLLILAALLLSVALQGCSAPQLSPKPTVLPTSAASDSLTVSFAVLLQSYFGLKNALVADDAHAANELARNLVVDIADFRLSISKDTSLRNIALPLLSLADSAVRAMISVDDESCEHQRIAFRRLSENFLLLVGEMPLRHVVIYRQHCPMAFNDRGADWMSESPEVRNPYFGRKMLECGEVSDTLY